MLSVVAAHGLSCPVAYGISVLRLGIEPTSPALEGGFLTTKSLSVSFVSCCPEFAPTTQTCSYFYSLEAALYSPTQRDICPGASTVALQQRAPGLSLSLRLYFFI